jgi:hypothetical protein
MISADIENAVAAQEIEVLRVIHVVEISAFRSGVDLVETDDALRGNQRPVEMTLMQLVIFAQPRRYDLLQVKGHCEAFVGDLRGKIKSRPRGQAT